jgi:hypothetical protein
MAQQEQLTCRKMAYFFLKIRNAYQIMKSQQEPAVNSPRCPDFLRGNTRQKILGGNLEQDSKHVTTSSQSKIFERYCLSDRRASSVDLKRQWEHHTGVHASYRYILRCPTADYSGRAV